MLSGLASCTIIYVKAFLYPFQHGFQKGTSCITQLLEVFYDIDSALDHAIKSDIIYLDHAKAFGYVFPAKLVSRGEYRGGG